jgi:hypothetical protein
MRRLAFLVIAAALTARPAFAQPTPPLDAKIHERWAAILAEVAHGHGKALSGGTLTAAPEERRTIYAEAIQRLGDDPELMKLATPDLSLVTAQTTADERKFLAQLKETDAEKAQAKSVDSASTSPAAGQLTERSGFTDFLALALRGQNFVSTDANAVSLNINALALYSLADPEVYSELYRYRQHSAVRRIGGTVVFGAKIPEKEITGISDLPDADKLFDAFTWDVKIRVLGDRDPRSSKWYGLTLGRGGMLTQASAVLTQDVPAGDLGMFVALLNDALGKNLAAIVTHIHRSPQLSFKTSGTHLSTAAGKNRYTGGALFDSGLGPDADLTANVLYSVVDDVTTGSASPFQVKQVNVNVSVTAHLAEGAIVKGRSLEWNGGTTATIFTNKSALPITVKNTWKLFSGFDIPIGDAAKIPISVVYTNDSNALEKTQYVKGQIGISYDFSALKKLFQQQP